MSDYVFMPANQWQIPPPGPSPDVHREQVTNFLLSASSHATSATNNQNKALTVLGAGPCQDVDLRRLAAKYAKVQLVDLDTDALQRGVNHQQMSNHPKLDLVAPFDLTGIVDLWPKFSTAPTHDANQLIGEMLNRINQFTWAPIDTELDVIASTCLLSQLILQVVENVGDRHVDFVELIQRLRKRHLQLMIDHLRVGGVGVIIFDFVSSDTLSRLPHLSGEPLKRALQAAIDQNNFFHGMNPQVIYHVLSHDLQGQLQNVSATPPWVWNAGERCYGVTAFIFEKR